MPTLLLCHIINTSVEIKLPADEAALIVVLPAGTRLTSDGSKVKAGDVIIAYK